MVLGDAVRDTARFLGLACSHKDVLKVLRWLDSLFDGREKYSRELLAELLNQP